MKYGILGPFWWPKNGDFGHGCLPLWYRYMQMVRKCPNCLQKLPHIWFWLVLRRFLVVIDEIWHFGPKFGLRWPVLGPFTRFLTSYSIFFPGKVLWYQLHVLFQIPHHCNFYAFISKKSYFDLFGGMLGDSPILPLESSNFENIVYHLYSQINLLSNTEKSIEKAIFNLDLS